MLKERENVKKGGEGWRRKEKINEMGGDGGVGLSVH